MNNKSHGIIIVLIIVIIGILSLIAKWGVIGYDLYINPIRVPSKVLLTAAYPDMQAGDLLLFIASFPWVGIFTEAIYSHVGMIVEIGDEVYISEKIPVDNSPAKNYDQLNIMPLPDQMGTTLLPLIPRLQSYVGTVHIMKMKGPLSDEQTAVLNEQVFIYEKYPSPYTFVLNYIMRPFGAKMDAQSHCFSHVAKLLDKIGLTPPELVAQNKQIFDLNLTRIAKTITTLWKHMPDVYQEPVNLLVDI